MVRLQQVAVAVDSAKEWRLMVVDVLESGQLAAATCCASGVTYLSPQLSQHPFREDSLTVMNKYTGTVPFKMKYLGWHWT